MLSIEHIDLRIQSYQAGLVYHEALRDYIVATARPTPLAQLQALRQASKERSMVWNVVLCALLAHLQTLEPSTSTNAEIERTRRARELLSIEFELIEHNTPLKYNVRSLNDGSAPGAEPGRVYV